MSDEAFQVIAVEERIRRHDVMSAVFALEKDAPDAAGIIHIGATSCYGTFTFGRIFTLVWMELIYVPSMSPFLFIFQALIADESS